MARMMRRPNPGQGPSRGIAAMLRRIINHCEGNVAPLFAMAFIPILGAVSAAVDYSRANLARNSMQAALDSTALMLSKEAQNLSVQEIEAKATGYFNAIFTSDQAHNVTIVSNLQNPQPGSYLLNVKGSADVPTSFTKVFGQTEISISATAEAVWGIKKLNLALALDNTGSMASSGKMEALKTAAHNLLNTLQAAAKSPGDIKVSIVPFATDVNVGSDKVNADWIDWSDWEAANGSCSKSWYKKQSSCESNGYVWTPADRSSWKGCVFDRDQHNDVANTAPVAGTPATMFRAHQASNCGASAMPLTEDWTAMHAKIDAMVPTGNTNVTIGLALGWQTLTPAAPYNAPPKAQHLDKVIVLLTDGDNTQNRWTTSSSSIDSRTQLACENAKADGVKLYTVRVINGDAALLKGCASKASMYYDVQETNQLNAAFESIAQNLANLRLTK
jgi:Flp pilus assembly protein TadG